MGPGADHCQTMRASDARMVTVRRIARKASPPASSHRGHHSRCLRGRDWGHRSLLFVGNDRIPGRLLSMTRECDALTGLPEVRHHDDAASYPSQDMRAASERRASTIDIGSSPWLSALGARSHARLSMIVLGRFSAKSSAGGGRSGLCHADMMHGQLVRQPRLATQALLLLPHIHEILLGRPGRPQWMGWGVRATGQGGVMSEWSSSLWFKPRRVQDCCKGRRRSAKLVLPPTRVAELNAPPPQVSLLSHWPRREAHALGRSAPWYRACGERWRGVRPLPSTLRAFARVVLRVPWEYLFGTF